MFPAIAISPGTSTLSRMTESEDTRINEDESDVIARCRRGEIPAFEAIYRRYRHRLFAVAYRFHGNRFDAEDSLQETFLAMYRNIGSFHGRSQFQTWMFRIAINACLTRKRRDRNRTERVDYADERAHPAASTGDEDALLRDLLEREIASLPPKQRVVFHLYATEGMTHPEIAEALRIRVGTSKSMYHRARTALKRRLIALGISPLEVTS